MENGERKDFESPLTQKELFLGLARLMVEFGEIHEPGTKEQNGHYRTKEDGRGFVLRGISPLKEAGLEEIEYVHESVLSGAEPAMNVLHVKFLDPDLDRSVIFMQSTEAEEVEVSMYIRPKTSLGDIPLGADQERAIQVAIANLFDPENETMNDDPLVAYYMARIELDQGSDDSPSLEDMQTIEYAYHLLRVWFRLVGKS